MAGVTYFTEHWFQPKGSLVAESNSCSLHFGCFQCQCERSLGKPQPKPALPGTFTKQDPWQPQTMPFVFPCSSSGLRWKELGAACCLDTPPKTARAASLQATSGTYCQVQIDKTRIKMSVPNLLGNCLFIPWAVILFYSIRKQNTHPYANALYLACKETCSGKAQTASSPSHGCTASHFTNDKVRWLPSTTLSLEKT